MRAIVGPDVVVGAELDPHCHLTPAMVESADLLIAYKEYPHTDVLERALELVDLCAATGREAGSPGGGGGRLRDDRHDAHLARAGALVRRPHPGAGGQGRRALDLHRPRLPLGRRARDGHQGAGLRRRRRSQGAGAGAPARRRADRHARRALAARIPSIDAALDEALAVDGGPVVISDGADNPGGGAASDSTFFLRRIVERGIGNVAIGPFWDPVAARIAIEAGDGARLPLRIGGKISPLSGDPLDLECTVKALRLDMCRPACPNTPRRRWATAPWSRASGIEILLCSLRNQAMGTDLFTGIGCDLATKKIVVVKSSQHFHASFSKIAAHVIYAAAPGAVTLDLRTLPYRKVRRPKWPLDA